MLELIKERLPSQLSQLSYTFWYNILSCVGSQAVISNDDESVKHLTTCIMSRNECNKYRYYICI